MRRLLLALAVGALFAAGACAPERGPGTTASPGTTGPGVTQSPGTSPTVTGEPGMTESPGTYP